MTESSNNRSDNAAWQAARQWQARARQARPTADASGSTSNGSKSNGFKLILTWLMFGVVMVVGTLFGLFFLLIGWLMLPLVRHRMKKRMEQMRADQAQDIGTGSAQPEHQRSHREQQVLEGDYRIKQ
ncbi:hypothetical protein [Halomonas sp. PR-M31]|uniref:hypothetical protein n=1 Tax=Halomonas sp. PR-M31 TaxID=1471202 RepID=UPI0006508343|nr:hypothetical protein [Halomonas sp. PR-M31]